MVSLYNPEKMSDKIQLSSSLSGDHKDDDSPEIILPDHAGRLEKALDEVQHLNEHVKSLKHTNSQLKKDLQASLEENMFLNYLINEVDAVIYVNEMAKDGSWEVGWINDQLEKITGYTLAEIRAAGSIQHFKDTFAPEHLNIVSGSWEFYKSGDEGCYSAVYKKRHKNGNWLWLYVIGHITKRGPNGEPEQSICVGFDLTKRINIDKNLRDLLYENLKLKNLALIQTLTKREKQILKLISKGLTNKEISTRLNISIHTVDSHRKSLLFKLNLNNTAALVRFSAECGLF